MRTKPKSSAKVAQNMRPVMAILAVFAAASVAESMPLWGMLLVLPAGIGLFVWVMRPHIKSGLEPATRQRESTP